MASYTMTRDEFIVDKDKVELIKRFENRIERGFEIKIHFDDVAEVDDSSKWKQWIFVEGEKVDRKNAREYIIALCQPESVQQFNIKDCHQEIATETIEQIEKASSAVLWKVDDNMIEIRGSELSVILAMSALENHVMKLRNDIEADGVLLDAESSKSDPDLASSIWSKEIDCRLLRGISSQSESTASIEDYNKTTPNVKMTILKCMNDIDDISDQDLFLNPSSQENSSSFKVPVFLEGEQLYDESCNSTASEKQNLNIENMEVDEPDSTASHNTSGNLGNLASKLTQANISNRNASEEDMQYLRTFGISVGYDEDTVEECLHYIDEKTKPADFLEMLSILIENRKKSQKENLEQSQSDSSKEFPPPPKVPDAENLSSIGRRSLPNEYKQRLMIDFNEEDDNLSVEELKKRNTERQKVLMNAFNTESTTNTSKTEASTPSSKKKRRKRKNKKKQGDGSKSQQTESEKSGTTLEKQTKATTDGSDVIVISSDNEDDDDNDEEETCVLKAWIPPAQNAQSEGGNVNIADMPVFTQQKCRGNSHAQNQQYPLSQYKPHYQNTPRNAWSRQPIPGGLGLLPIPQRGGFPHYYRQPVPYLPRGPIIEHRQPRPYYNNQGCRENMPPHPMKQGGSVKKQQQNLRYIVIDGSNVAMSHGNGKFFSCKGIKIVIDYFLKRGHKEVTAFVPEWRKYNPRPDTPIRDQELLNELKEQGYLVFTPSRRINGRLITSYDDRYVLALAETEEGIIVSNDQYRDLMREKASWRKIIEERLLLYSFAGNNFMPPEDPLGRDGPTLNEFLCKNSGRKRAASPSQTGWDFQYEGGYDRNSANNNRFQRNQFNEQFNPGNPNVQFRNNMRDHGNDKFQHRTEHFSDNRGRGRGGGVRNSPRKPSNDQPARSSQKTKELTENLKAIFPDKEAKIVEILQNHPSEIDLTKLTNYLMNAMF